MIPVLLYNFTAWMLGISQEVTLEKFVVVEKSVHLKMLSLLQDLLYLESKGQKPTPKHYCLGMMLHHLSGSSSIVGILNKLGHCSSRLVVSSLETALAQLQASSNELQIPTGFCSAYTTVVWDNIDFSQETVSGKGTTHHTNEIIVQRLSISNMSMPSYSTERAFLPKRKHVVESQPIKVLPYTKKKRVGPLLRASSSSPIHLERSSHTDVAHLFFVYAFLKTFDDAASIPNWTGYNTLFCGNINLVKDRIGYLPMIPASPTSYDTVFTMMKRSVAIADQLRIPSITIVVDMAIYIKAQDIRWADRNLHNRTVIRLGEFHTCMTFFAVIGKRFGDAGSFDILVESEVVAIGSANAVLQDRHYNRAILAHKVVAEALEHLKFEAYFNSIHEDLQTEIIDSAKLQLSVFPSTSNKSLLQESVMQNLLKNYDEFCATQSSISPTFALWQSYVDMVSTLLHFISCTRRSDREGHLNTLEKMTPWLFAYDRVNYSRYVPVYLKEMRELEKTHPFAHEHLNNGEFAIQQQDRYAFSATAADQVIEQTINRDSKSAGGKIGITTRPNAVAKWVLSQSQRLAMTQLCRKYADQDETDRHRKNLDPPRQARDVARVDSVIKVVEAAINPFSYDGSELVNIYSGIVASASCQHDFLKAFESGRDFQLRFTAQVTSDPKQLHSPLKKLHLQTFKSATSKHKKDKKGKCLFKQKNICSSRYNGETRQSQTSRCTGLFSWTSVISLSKF